MQIFFKSSKHYTTKWFSVGCIGSPWPTIATRGLALMCTAPSLGLCHSQESSRLGNSQFSKQCASNPGQSLPGGRRYLYHPGLQMVLSLALKSDIISIFQGYMLYKCPCKNSPEYKLIQYPQKKQKASSTNRVL